MKITTFNPLIVSTKAEEIIKLFEELGFERRHLAQNADYEEIKTARMKDSSGFYVDVAHAEGLSRDMTIIRMNVDDFDEAYDILVRHGFINHSGKTFERTSSKSAFLVSPSGFAIDLVKHIKDKS